MKKYLLFLLLMSGHSIPYSQTVADGYIFHLTNDSVSAKIRVPKMMFSGIDIERLEKKVKSSYGGDEKFAKLSPKEIKGFSFEYKNRPYRFVAKNIRKNNLKFCQVIYAGVAETAYYYYKTGNKGHLHEEVIIEQVDGGRLTLYNSMTRRKIRRRLKEFLAGVPASRQLIENKTLHLRRLDSYVSAILQSVND